MSDPRRLGYLALVFGGVPTIFFMVAQLYRTIRRGTIARRVPLQPFTKSGTPVMFWGLVSFVGLATVGIMCSWVLALLRLTGSE